MRLVNWRSGVREAMEAWEERKAVRQPSRRAVVAVGLGGFSVTFLKEAKMAWPALLAFSSY